MPPIRVMLVDPDRVSLAASAAVLADAGVDVVAQSVSGEEALRLVPASQPTVAVVDLGVGGMGPATTVRRIRDLLGHRIDIVAQASFADVDRIGDMVATGTAAYVVKGKFDDLVAAVRAVAAGSGLLSAEASRPLLEEVHRRYEAEQARTSELEKTVARLQAVSVTDWLTGLKNHGYFWQRLSEELERARRYDRPLAVIMADLDDFKAVNDEHGHAAGDEVLRAVGEAMLAAVRESDIACRVGGEEFAIIVPETSAVGALQASERVREAIMAASVGSVGRITISLGVAVFPFHATEARELVESADRALYDAKHAGKNCSRIAGGPTTRSATAIDPYGASVSALMGALELRDAGLARHAERVADLATAMAVTMELSSVDRERLRLAAMLHDLGMIGVPDAIRQHAGPLSNEQWETLKVVPEQGRDLVARSVHADVASAVYSQRERFDGSGYPDGLSGGDIPLMARILAVADAYDAMLSPKSYRPRRGTAEVMAELRRHAGTQFDPAVVSVLETVLEEDTSADIIEFPA